MNDLWGGVFEYFKERRYAAVFFGTLLAVVGALLAGLILRRVTAGCDLKECAVYAVPGALLLLLACVSWAVPRVRVRRRGRPEISQMSRDELQKARSKLLKH